MAKQKLIIKDFTGALGFTHEKKDIPNAAKFMKGLNPFEDPNYITLSTKPTKVSGSTADQLVYWIEDGSPYSTNRYFYADSGDIYQETSGGTWSLLQATSGSNGEGFKVFDDYLYYARTTEMGRYGPLSGTPAFQDSFSGWWIDSQLTTTGGGTGAADYVPPTAIDDTTATGTDDRQTFKVKHDPIYSITIDVDVIGSGDWTVTLHNANNDSLGSQTLTNAEMVTAGVGDVEFVLDSLARAKVGENYHFHVTSTVADGGVDTDVATDLEGAEFTVTYSALLSATFHPIETFALGIVFGNERYIGYFDNATYDPTKIELPAGFEVRTLAKFDEYIVAGCYKGGSIKESEYARLYYWDGTSPTPNYFTDSTVGAANALLNYKNTLMGVYGNKGGIYIGDDPFQDVVDKVPKLPRGKYINVFPGAVTNYKGKAYIGMGGDTDDGTTVEQGIFEYGRQDVSSPEVLNFNTEISTGTSQGTTLKIGCVKGIGEDLYIGWRDGASTYGVDKISVGDNANASSEYETLIFDGGDPNKEFLPLNLICTFEALGTNESVTPKYSYNRAGSFTAGTTVTAGSNTRAEEALYNRCKEIELGFTLASSSGTYPKITSLVLEYDDLIEEGTNE